MPTTAIFDIGKTNKKFFIFDEKLEVLHREYQNIPLIEDKDGHPSDDLQAIVDWMLSTLERALQGDWGIQHLNFSTYGATMIYLDANRKSVTPYVLNYTKSVPETLQPSFFQNYGGQEQVCKETASPPLEMLNSGWQLYFLKQEKPELFTQIRHALHLPQFCSSLLTQKLCSEPTSIGCHTMLWDFEKKDYHHWLEAEGMRTLFPETVPTTTTFEVHWRGHDLTVGVGIHDSSAALLPYLLTNDEPFLLISTGTWSITLNPFNQSPLTAEELQQDCLNFLRMDGRPVKASRLFLGREYQLQVTILQQHFQQEAGFHKTIAFDAEVYEKVRQSPTDQFRMQVLPQENAPVATDVQQFENYLEAYHRLMHELVQWQLNSLQLAKGDTDVRRIFVDGGFVDSAIFIKLLELHLPDFEIIPTKAPLGSAIGAAMAVQYDTLDATF